MTLVPFPSDRGDGPGVPAHYHACTWRSSTAKPHGVYELGDTVTIELTGTGATGYTVYDYWGAIVSSGSMSAAATTVAPTAPIGGWKACWYIAVGRGPIVDDVWADTYWVTSFQFGRANANFLDLLPGNHFGDTYGDPLERGNDPIMRACMGIAPGRLELPELTDAFFTINGSYTAPSAASWLGKVGVEADFARTWWLDPGTAILDPARQRYVWCSFPQFAVDRVILPNGEDGSYLSCYPLDDTSHDPTQVFVSIGAGSSSGAKIRVYYPNSSTVVETYDNQASVAAASAAINAGSAYIRAFRATGDPTATPGTLAATAIGNTVRAKVVGAVSYLYGKGVTHFEGPVNEPDIPNGVGVGWEHIAKLFGLYVNTTAGAQSIGPTPVKTFPENWLPYLDAGGATSLNKPATHDYNNMDGVNLPLGRHKLNQFAALLDGFGLSIADCWQTEGNTVLDKLFGVYHIRLAAFRLLHTLLWEQQGVPRERNPPWYDSNHGFSDWPGWLENGDGSLSPDCAMLRVLAEETWGQLHDEILDFGSPGNDIMVGSVFAGDLGKTVQVMMGSQLPGATVTLTTSATGALTVVNAFGQESTATVVGGLVTIPVQDVPTYLRLPADATVSVYTLFDWPDITLVGQGHNSSVIASAKVGDAVTAVPTQTGLMTDYATQAGVFTSTGDLPEPIDLAFPITRTDLIIVWCTPPSQGGNSTITKFQLETSDDEETWTTQTVKGPDGIAVTTVDVTADATSMVAASDSAYSACIRITFWGRQSVFVLRLASPVSAKFFRVNVLETSNGGEPDAASAAANGQGNADQRISIQRVGVYLLDPTLYWAHL